MLQNTKVKLRTIQKISTIIVRKLTDFEDCLPSFEKSTNESV